MHVDRKTAALALIQAYRDGGGREMTDQETAEFLAGMLEARATASKKNAKLLREFAAIKGYVPPKPKDAENPDDYGICLACNERKFTGFMTRRHDEDEPYWICSACQTAEAKGAA